jgi:hypothetical protein
VKRIWVSRLAAAGRLLAIVPLVVAATVLRMRLGEIRWSMGGARAQARRRRYAGELMAEIAALRERETSIAEHPYRFAVADLARRSACRGRARSG